MNTQRSWLALLAVLLVAAGTAHGAAIGSNQVSFTDNVTAVSICAPVTVLLLPSSTDSTTVAVSGERLVTRGTIRPTVQLAGASTGHSGGRAVVSVLQGQSTPAAAAPPRRVRMPCVSPSGRAQLHWQACVAPCT